MKIVSVAGMRTPDVGQLAEQALRQSPYYFLRQLACDFQGGVLTLRGRVPSRQLAVRAEAIVARVDGVEAVANLLEIGEPLHRTSDQVVPADSPPRRKPAA
jgi:hypothetical protein